MQDLIAAIATGTAPGGVGIVRLSGTGALTLAAQLFVPRSGAPLLTRPNRQLVYGSVQDADGSVLDAGLCFLARAGSSYTGEDTAELQVHGSPMLLQLILERCFALGARAAAPGEFTKRAFLSGGLDLMQAEAVIDLIDAETPAAAKQAAAQLDGALSRRVSTIYDGLVDLMAHFFAVLDYPDEDIDPFRAALIHKALAEARLSVEQLLASYARGKQILSGIPCAIIGRPNVGKSSLLNLLAGFERAIVTDTPGTTRDTIELRVNLGAQSLRLIDTAGLRDSSDAVEQIGVQRSHQAAAEAQLVLLVLDASAPLQAEDRAAIALARSAPACLCVLNKADKPSLLLDADLPDFAQAVRLCARTGEGLADLETALGALFPTGGTAQRALLTNARQYGAAQMAHAALTRAQEGLESALPPDLLLIDVEEAIEALGALSGRVMRDDVTGRIFERFCVGK